MTERTRHETPDVAELRRLAEAAGELWHYLAQPDQGLDDGRDDYRFNVSRDDAAYIAAASPAAVLNLLDRLAHMTEARDAARAEVGRLTAQVEAVRALHYAADNDLDRTPICETCRGAAGAHECGCWAETDRQPICGHCHDDWGRSGSISYPCPTIDALGGERS